MKTTYKRLLVIGFFILLGAYFVYSSNTYVIEFSNGDLIFTKDSISFNDTRLNATIISLAQSSVDTNETVRVNYLFANYYNGTDTNETVRIARITSTNCTGQTIAYFHQNGTGVCEADDSGDAGSGYNGSTINTTIFKDVGSNLNINTTWWDSVWAKLTDLVLLNTSIKNYIPTQGYYSSDDNITFNYVQNETTKVNYVYANYYNNSVSYNRTQIDLNFTSFLLHIISGGYYTSDDNITFNYIRNETPNMNLVIGTYIPNNVSVLNTRVNNVNTSANINGLFADDLTVDKDANLTENNVEAYIFDSDNTANLNMSTYNISFGQGVLYWNGSCLCQKNIITGSEGCSC